MKNPIVYAINMVRVCWLKIRYSGRLNIGWIQSFEHVRFECSKCSNSEIGSYNQGRGNLYIGVFGHGKLKVANHCFFNINCSITCLDSIEIGDNCKFGNNIVIVDHDHNYKAKGEYNADNPEFVSSPIKIGNNVWCGANVVILRGTVIGDNCVIGAGSIVKGRIPEGTLLVKGQVREIK